MIHMIGIGLFVTLPLVMGFMGPNFLLIWLVGAGLPLVNGLIWSKQGAAYPEAGGSRRPYPIGSASTPFVSTSLRLASSS